MEQPSPIRLPSKAFTLPESPEAASVIEHEDPEQALQHYLAEKQEENLIHQVTRRKIVQLLVGKSPCEVADLLHSLRDSHAILQELEESADMSILRELLCSGGSCVRGTDKEGRPVVWLRTPRNAKSMPVQETVLHIYWLVRWAYQLRPSDDSGIIICVDDRGRAAVDFNISYFKLLAEILTKSKAGCEHEALVVLCPGSASKWAFQAFFKYISSFLDQTSCTFTIDPEDIREMLADPTNVPESHFPTNGRRFTLDVESVGDYQSLLLRKGFRMMTVSDWTNPSSGRLVHLRQTYSGFSGTGDPVKHHSLEDLLGRDEPQEANNEGPVVRQIGCGMEACAVSSLKPEDSYPEQTSPYSDKTRTTKGIYSQCPRRRLQLPDIAEELEPLTSSEDESRGHF